MSDQARKRLVIALVAVLVIALGIGGGVLLGLSGMREADPTPTSSATRDLPEPTPTPLLRGTRSVFRIDDATAVDPRSPDPQTSPTSEASRRPRASETLPPTSPSPLESVAPSATVQTASPDPAQAAELEEAAAVIRMRMTEAEVEGRVTVEPPRIIVEAPPAVDVELIRHLAATHGRLSFVAIHDPRLTPLPGDPVDPRLGEVIGGDIFVSLEPGTDEFGSPSVVYRLRSPEASEFNRYTAEHIGQSFAVALDGVTLSVLVIQAPTQGADGHLSSSFDQIDLNVLIAILRSGPLPIPLARESVEPIGPSIPSSDPRTPGTTE